MGCVACSCRAQLGGNCTTGDVPHIIVHGGPWPFAVDWHQGDAREASSITGVGCTCRDTECEIA
eukprot:15462676-Alexandrium_andersonii.AAC.1